MSARSQLPRAREAGPVLREQRPVAPRNRDDKTHEEEDKTTDLVGWKKWYTKTKLKEFLLYHALPEGYRQKEKDKKQKAPATVLPVIDSLVRIGMAICTHPELVTKEIDRSYRWRWKRNELAVTQETYIPARVEILEVRRLGSDVRPNGMGFNGRKGSRESSVSHTTVQEPPVEGQDVAPDVSAGRVSGTSVAVAVEVDEDGDPISHEVVDFPRNARLCLELSMSREGGKKWKPWLSIKPSSVRSAGLGLFAETTFHKGTALGYYTGKVIWTGAKPGGIYAYKAPSDAFLRSQDAGVGVYDMALMDRHGRIRLVRPAPLTNDPKQLNHIWMGFHYINDATQVFRGNDVQMKKRNNCMFNNDGLVTATKRIEIGTELFTGYYQDDEVNEPAIAPVAAVAQRSDISTGDGDDEEAEDEDEDSVVYEEEEQEDEEEEDAEEEVEEEEEEGTHGGRGLVQDEAEEVAEDETEDDAGEEEEGNEEVRADDDEGGEEEGDEEYSEEEAGGDDVGDGDEGEQDEGGSGEAGIIADDDNKNSIGKGEQPAVKDVKGEESKTVLAAAASAELSAQAVPRSNVDSSAVPATESTAQSKADTVTESKRRLAVLRSEKKRKNPFETSSASSVSSSSVVPLPAMLSKKDGDSEASWDEGEQGTTKKRKVKKKMSTPARKVGQNTQIGKVTAVQGSQKKGAPKKRKDATEVVERIPEAVKAAITAKKLGKAGAVSALDSPIPRKKKKIATKEIASQRAGEQRAGKGGTLKIRSVSLVRGAKVGKAAAKAVIREKSSVASAGEEGSAKLKIAPAMQKVSASRTALPQGPKTGSTSMASAKANIAANMAKAKPNGDTGKSRTKETVVTVTMEPSLAKRKVTVRRSR